MNAIYSDKNANTYIVLNYGPDLVLSALNVINCL